MSSTISLFSLMATQRILKTWQEILVKSKKEKSRTYMAIQAFVQPTLETTKALQELRTNIQMRHQLATTVGYGPRFLHSTGQLHKGDGGNGLFIQITSDFEQDAPIPDSAGEEKSTMSFGVLALAQALGDRQALIEAGRSVFRFHLGQDFMGGMKTLIKEVK